MSGVIKLIGLSSYQRRSIWRSCGISFKNKIEILTTYEDVKEHGKLLNPNMICNEKFKENVIAENLILTKQKESFEYLRDEK
ncbi:hypothetical protein PO124_22550 [Bacillus licheniformis]|nr:hypothetical protein [Bacillus licheniformis]